MANNKIIDKKVLYFINLIEKDQVFTMKNETMQIFHEFSQSHKINLHLEVFFERKKLLIV